MKKLPALLFALLLLAALSACGQEATPPESTEPAVQTELPETEPEPTMSAEGYYIDEVVKEDGTKIIRHRLGNIKGKIIWSRTENPDGTFSEKSITPEGATASEKYSDADGIIHEMYYYPEGALKKDITLFPDGSSEETHYEYGEHTGLKWILGPVLYTKTVSADGRVTEEGHPVADIYYEADGSWWETIRTPEGAEDKIHFSADGRRIARTYTSSDLYLHEEFYENGLEKAVDSIHPDGTEISYQCNEQGYYTYYRRKDQYGEIEYFAGENNELVKYIENGTVYEGDAISQQNINNFKEMQGMAAEKAYNIRNGI